jgi:putative membrane-bound dehydrogenase-like protein
MKRLLLSILTLLLLFSSCQKKEPLVDYDQLDEKAKRLPENSIAGMEVPAGLEVKLFASEPMLINPTNIQVDERGRVWVCEALNYRNEFNPENPHRKAGDRILILEDTDGDSKADKKTVFFQDTSINAALGIWVVQNRAIVSCSPYVFILTDTNGDDKADRTDTLFTGLSGLQSDHAVHAFTVGPDGKFYFNFGNNGKQIGDKKGRPVLDPQGNAVNDQGKPYRQGMVFRCNPDGTGLEVLAHNFRNNYEVAADSYGTLWQSDNDDDGNMGVRINYVMEAGNFGYTDQMTGAAWSARRVNMESEIPLRHWHLNDPGVVPNVLQTGSGSPCGITVYEGDLLPKIFQNQMIHAEAGHNVVRAYPVLNDKAGYKGNIVNLVKSKDQWFRPSDVAVAPDGSIFIADWYDPAVGGHKFGDPERGRIYRVAPKGNRYRVVAPSIDNPKSAVKALQSPNLPTQALAKSKLAAFGKAAIPALEELWKKGESRFRARALWVLAKMDPVFLQKAITDKDADIRITALRAARQLQPAKVLDFVQKIVHDPAPQVRREAAIALQNWNTTEADQLWVALAKQHDGTDRWYLEALGIGADRNSDARFAAWKTAVGTAWNTPGGRDIIWRSRSNAALPFLVAIISDAKTGKKELPRYFRAFDFHTGTQKDSLLALLPEGHLPLQDTINILTLNLLDPDFVKKSPAVQKTIARILPRLQGSADYLELVRKLNLSNQNTGLLNMALHHTDGALRAEAAGLLAERGGLPQLIVSLKNGDEAQKLQLLGAVGYITDPRLYALYGQYLKDPQLSLSLRRGALNALNSSWDGQISLMQLVEQGQVPVELRPQAVLSLAGAWNTELRQKARAMLAKEQQGQERPLPAIAVLEGKSGNMASGKKVYQTYCANCHQVGYDGVKFGPALTEIGSKMGKDGLYQAILYPSSGISFGYEGFNVHLKDGNLFQGIIESKTAATLTMRLMGGVTKEIATADVKKIEEMSQSLMTEGLYRSFSEQQLVDLIEYLAGLKSAEEKLSMK